MNTITVQTAMLLANTLYQRGHEGGHLNIEFETPENGYLVFVDNGPSFMNLSSVDVLDVKHFIMNQEKLTEKHGNNVFFRIYPIGNAVNFSVFLRFDDLVDATQEAMARSQDEVYYVERCQYVDIEGPPETYYSIRTMIASSEREAIDKIEQQDFDESNPICDRVVTLDELKRLLEDQ